MRATPIPVADTWQGGDPYERYMGRWSRRVAPAFLAWLDLPPGRRWLDVGCGTGALGAAILQQCAPAQVTGVEPSAGFLQKARASMGERMQLHQGKAEAIPLPDGAADAVVSGLVLNFVPDAPAALREMARVAAPQGTVAAYVWDYAQGMDLMRHFWEAAAAVEPAAAQLDQGLRYPVCHPDALRALFAGAGLQRVEVTAIEIPTVFEDFDAYWEPFLGGAGTAPAYAVSLAPDARERLRQALRARVPIDADGAIRLQARAWAVRGQRAPDPLAAARRKM